MITWKKLYTFYLKDEMRILKSIYSQKVNLKVKLLECQYQSQKLRKQKVRSITLTKRKNLKLKDHQNQLSNCNDYLNQYLLKWTLQEPETKWIKSMLCLGRWDEYQKRFLIRTTSIEIWRKKLIFICCFQTKQSSI